MKDFDAERIIAPPEKRKLKIANEEISFSARVSPDLLVNLLELPLGKEWLAAADRLMDAVLETDEDRATWARIRASDNVWTPSLRELDEIVGYVLEVTSGRPIESSSVSSGGLEATGTSSTPSSSTTAEPA